MRDGVVRVLEGKIDFYRMNEIEKQFGDNVNLSSDEDDDVQIIKTNKLEDTY
jgi:hypothetical protein